MWWVLLLISVLLPVAALLGVAALSTLGLEPDQVQLKKSYRWLGAIGVLTVWGQIAGSTSSAGVSAC